MILLTRFLFLSPPFWPAYLSLISFISFLLFTCIFFFDILLPYFPQIISLCFCNFWSLPHEHDYFCPTKIFILSPYQSHLLFSCCIHSAQCLFSIQDFILWLFLFFFFACHTCPDDHCESYLPDVFPYSTILSVSILLPFPYFIPLSYQSLLSDLPSLCHSSSSVKNFKFQKKYF